MKKKESEVLVIYPLGRRECDREKKFVSIEEQIESDEVDSAKLSGSAKRKD